MERLDGWASLTRESTRAVESLPSAGVLPETDAGASTGSTASRSGGPGDSGFAGPVVPLEPRDGREPECAGEHEDPGQCRGRSVGVLAHGARARWPGDTPRLPGPASEIVDELRLSGDSGVESFSHP